MKKKVFIAIGLIVAISGIFCNKQKQFTYNSLLESVEALGSGEGQTNCVYGGSYKCNAGGSASYSYTTW